MRRVAESRLVQEIADRAARLYSRFGVQIKPEYIASEIDFVHNEVVALRLQDFADADDENFAHDIGGIHRHLNMPMKRLDDCFLPRFADLSKD